MSLLVVTATTVVLAATVTFDVPPFAPYNGSNPTAPWNDTSGNHYQCRVARCVQRRGRGHQFLPDRRCCRGQQQSGIGLRVQRRDELLFVPRPAQLDPPERGERARSHQHGGAVHEWRSVGPSRFVFRTHVAFNTSTRKYVMWGKSSDSPAWSNQTYFRATADAPCGPYTLVTSDAHLPAPGYFDDDNMFVDPNSTESPKAAYVVYSGGSLDRSTRSQRQLLLDSHVDAGTVATLLNRCDSLSLSTRHRHLSLAEWRDHWSGRYG